MANYISASRSNLFRVTDENAYAKLIKGLSGEDVFLENEADADGVIRHFIGSYGGIDWYPPASMSEDLLAATMETKTVYDDNGNAVAKDQIDNYDTLFDEDGNVVFEKYYGDPDFDMFIEKLQKLLPDDEVFTYVEAGNEKLRDVSAYVYVVSNKEVRFMSTHKFMEDTKKELLGKTES